MPAEWVEEATKSQNKTGGDDDYGYGWWISEISYGASGRNGQRIFMVPSLDAIVVTTGGGFEYDEIGPYLTGALVDTRSALPPNPEGGARLSATLASLAESPKVQPVEPRCPRLRARSRARPMSSTQPIGLETMKIEFNDPAEAVVYIHTLYSQQPITWRIGLDGVYRRMPSGEALRGGWARSTNLRLRDLRCRRRTYQVKFLGDKIEIASPEMGIGSKGSNRTPNYKDWRVLPTMRYRYYTADVFTERIFGGNPLAVFPERRG